MKRVSLVLVDDCPSAREGMGALIRAQPGFQVLAASAKREAALRQVRGSKPDLVLLNLAGAGDDSLALARALHGEVPESRVLIMGLEPRHEDLASFVRVGVSGFIMAKASFDTFLSTIHSVARGIQVLPPELTRSLFGQLVGYGGRRRRRRTLALERPADHGRLEVAAWSLPSRPSGLDHSPLV